MLRFVSRRAGERQPIQRVMREARRVALRREGPTTREVARRGYQQVGARYACTVPAVIRALTPAGPLHMVLRKA